MGFEEVTLCKHWENHPFKLGLKKFKNIHTHTPINTSLMKMCRICDLRYQTIALKNFYKQVGKIYLRRKESVLKRLILS